jgi:hypothetical protein
MVAATSSSLALSPRRQWVGATLLAPLDTKTVHSQVAEGPIRALRSQKNRAQAGVLDAGGVTVEGGKSVSGHGT